MRIRNPAITSDVYRLVKTIEFDMELEGKFLPTRVEVFQDTQRKRHFRCHMWELEYYHVQSTFSAAGKGKRGRSPSDEPIFFERTWELSSKFHDFVAPSAEAALNKFLALLKKHLAAVKK